MPSPGQDRPKLNRPPERLSMLAISVAKETIDAEAEAPNGAVANRMRDVAAAAAG